MIHFWNRTQELAQIRRQMAKGGFGYVTGRRRVGKSALLEESCRIYGGLYHQAVEGTAPQQLLHVVEEWRSSLPIFRDVTPKQWGEFFRLLSREKLPPLMVFDEFPYWVKGDPMLPSIFQKWVDHDLAKTKILVLVSGSSQSMLYSQFLNPSAPLYGRTHLHLPIEFLSYAWFCRALKYELEDPKTFALFSLVGGIPHYWKLMRPGSVIDQANHLYFEPGAILAEEPGTLIRDEGITGTIPKAILDFIGRGVTKPGEIAARLGIPQGNLSRPLAMLLDLKLIWRDLPFGESSRTTKKVLYNLHDPALSFYYGIYLPHRSYWPTLSPKQRGALINQHASRQWEHFCRDAYPGSSRYWEGNIEIDLIAPKKNETGYLVAECKWVDLTIQQEDALLKDLQEKFALTKLSYRLQKVAFRIFSKKDVSLVANRKK